MCIKLDFLSAEVSFKILYKNTSKKLSWRDSRKISIQIGFLLNWKKFSCAKNPIKIISSKFDKTVWNKEFQQSKMGSFFIGLSEENLSLTLLISSIFSNFPPKNQF